MFIIRSAFWLALLVAILPSDPKEQVQLYQTASYAINRAATFCERNQALCEEAAAHWDVFKAKLYVGATMARALINERMHQERRNLDQPFPQAPHFERDAASADTLSRHDRSLQWVRPTPSKL